MSKLSKQYDPHEHEAAVYKVWEQAGAFAPSDQARKSGKTPFVIMLPPPNITGSLHMGHALQDTIIDILTRYHRMHGEPTLWLPGTDHAAIATNKIIEKQLAEEGKARHDVGREEFLKRTEEWYAKTEAEILNQMKRLGVSCDWSRQRFTLDDAYYHSVQEAFVRYHAKGYIYRGARIVNWDPSTQTTVSDLEIDWKTEKAPLYTFQYGPFQITTARPETKFGDKYVVMHPADERYAKYKHGDTFAAEWINGKVLATVIKDESVDPAFGTGVMTITPWHDATDFAIAQRHKLDLEQIIGFDGKLLPIAGEFTGMTAQAARPKIVEKLQEKGLVVSVNENYEHNVALNDRGKGIIEPQVMRQWFLDMQKLKGETIEVAEKDMVEFLPARWKKHFLTWMEGVLDWNINRQIWLGHRLPVWWKKGTHGTENEEGNYIVSLEQPADGDYEQDPDVLDTWFSSALWPFATLGWPENTADLKTFYPTTILVTARDILYLWVARMIFSGLELMQGEEYGNRDKAQRLPFRQVFIHPTVLAKGGQRMSKSLGTGIDPLELIEKYGADATRFGLMYQMSYDNQAIRFDEEAIKSARNFANKIWNIARLLESLEDRADSTAADEWIEERFQAVASDVTHLIEACKFGEAARLLYDFVWKDFADWYVEILKVTGSTQAARGLFRRILLVLHPFMPHLTEVLWPQFGGKSLLVVEAWPDLNQTEAGKTAAHAEVERLQAIVETVRSVRTLLAIPAGETIDLAVEKPPLPLALTALTRANLIDQTSPKMKTFPTVSGETIALASPSFSPERIEVARQKLQQEAARITTFLNQQEQILQKMRAKAPPKKIAEKEAVIAANQRRLAEIKRSLKALR